MKDYIFTIIGLIMTYTVFIFLYPEYALPSDLCYYIEDGREIPCENSEEALMDILNADADSIEIRFRLWDSLMKTVDMEGQQTCQKEMNRKQQYIMTTEKKRLLGYLTPVWAD